MPLMLALRVDRLVVWLSAHPIHRAIFVALYMLVVVLAILTDWWLSQ
jgi:hypothetical protein